MENIFIFKNGGPVPAKIERMFETHGPYLIEGKRLDQLIKAQVIVDTSTSTVLEKGISKESPKTGSMLGRAVAGAVIAGGTGAIIGGLSGKKESYITTVSSESLNVDITVELLFEDNSSIYVQVRNINAFHWILSFANCKAMTECELNNEKIKASMQRFNSQIADAYSRAFSSLSYSKINWIPADDNEIKKVSNEVIELMYKDFIESTEAEQFLDFNEFKSKHIDLIRSNIKSIQNPVDYSDNINLSKAIPLALIITIGGVIFFNLFDSEKDISQVEAAAKYQEQSININKPKTEQEIALDYFTNNHEEIINNINTYLKNEDYKNAILLAEKYAFTKDPSIIDFKAKSEKLLAEKAKQKEEEKQKQSELELKKLKANSVFSDQSTTIKLNKAIVSDKWIFDDHGNQYSYRESEKGSKYIVLQVSISSKSKNPALFGVGLYMNDDGALWLINKFEYEFVKWSDYGSYLGNYADYRNDFSHSTTIPFSLGASIENNKLGKSLYIVATREGCNERRYMQFETPPISYTSAYCESLSSVLKAEDFKNGKLSVLKIFGAEKNKK